MTLTDSHRSLASFCQNLFLSSVIGRNDNDSEYHLDVHQMVCIAYKTDGGKLGFISFLSVDFMITIMIADHSQLFMAFSDQNKSGRHYL